MATYKGWTIVAIPTSPAAPASIEVTLIDPVAMSVSPFTGQQQIQIWSTGWRELSVSMPPMPDAQAQAWLTFLAALGGVACVFQFTAAFTAAYGLTVPSGKYYRLKQNARKWSISQQRFYGIQFECVEAF